MGLLTNFLNPNAMSNEKIIKFADYIVNTECQSEIRNLVGGMIEAAEFHDAVKNGMDPNKYINFLRGFTNLLDNDEYALQRKTNNFANSFANDLRILSRSHPIIKLYSLIIDMNTCCKNYCICEYEVLEVIYNVNSEKEVVQKVLDIRSKSNLYLKESEKMLNILMDIKDNPHKVLSL